MDKDGGTRLSHQAGLWRGPTLRDLWTAVRGTAFRAGQVTKRVHSRDPGGERALVVVGGTLVPRLNVLNAWHEHSHEARVLGPSVGPRRWYPARLVRRSLVVACAYWRCQMVSWQNPRHDRPA